MRTFLLYVQSVRTRSELGINGTCSPAFERLGNLLFECILRPLSFSSFDATHIYQLTSRSCPTVSGRHQQNPWFFKASPVVSSLASGVIFQWGSQLAVFKIVISWLLEMLDRCERVSTAILNAYHHLVSHTKCCLESLQIIPVLLKDS